MLIIKSLRPRRGQKPSGKQTTTRDLLGVRHDSRGLRPWLQKIPYGDRQHSPGPVVGSGRGVVSRTNQTGLTNGHREVYGKSNHPYPPRHARRGVHKHRRYRPPRQRNPRNPLTRSTLHPIHCPGINAHRYGVNARRPEAGRACLITQEACRLWQYIEKFEWIRMPPQSAADRMSGVNVNLGTLAGGGDG